MNYQPEMWRVKKLKDKVQLFLNLTDDELRVWWVEDNPTFHGKSPESMCENEVDFKNMEMTINFSATC